MINGCSVSLVMPCRNESKYLAALVKDVPSFYDEILCVSNKSTDETVQVVARSKRATRDFAF